MPALWGTLLSGLSQGFNNYNQQQEDLSFQRQQRVNQLAAEQLANQGRSLENQQQQNAIAQDQAQTGFLTGAAQDVYGSGQPAGAQGLASAAQSTASPPQAAGNALATSNPAPVSKQQVANPSLPAPLRVNNPGALMGKDGKLQTFPTLQAGMQALDSNLQSYGNKGINTIEGIVDKWAPASAGNDTQAYIKDVSQRMGVPPGQALNMQDPTVRAALARSIAIHENGRAAAESTLQGARATQAQQQGQQSQQQGQQTSAALAQPSPADNLSARTNAGAEVRPDEYQQAAQATMKQASMYKDAAQKAFQAGNVKAGQAFADKANALTDQALKTQKDGFAAQKDANTETAKLAVGVADQSSYSNFQAQIRNNPAMQRAVAGLNLTGDYDQDKQKIQTLADRTETLKDQQEIGIKKQELDLKIAQDKRAQDKADLPRVQAQQAVIADQTRSAANTAKGVPSVPSLAATMGGASPQQIQAQQAKINTMRNAYVTTQLSPAMQGSQKVDDYSKEIIGLLDPKAKGGAVTTGGWSSIPGVSQVLTGVEPSRQQFDKAANNLVLAQQQSLMSLGAARSSGTAAMAKIIGSAKPNMNVNDTTNREIATHIYIANQFMKSQQQFMSEFLKANPSAQPVDGLLEWQRFENSLGSLTYEDDKAKTRVRFSDKIAKTNPDGTPNPKWVDFHDWFKANPD